MPTFMIMLNYNKHRFPRKVAEFENQGQVVDQAYEMAQTIEVKPRGARPIVEVWERKAHFHAKQIQDKKSNG